MWGLKTVVLVIVMVKVVVGQQGRTVNTLQMLMESVERQGGDGKQFVYKILESEKAALEHNRNRKDHAGELCSILPHLARSGTVRYGQTVASYQTQPSIARVSKNIEDTVD